MPTSSRSIVANVLLRLVSLVARLATRAPVELLDHATQYREVVRRGGGDERVRRRIGGDPSLATEVDGGLLRGLVRRPLLRGLPRLLRALRRAPQAAAVLSPVAVLIANA